MVRQDLDVCPELGSEDRHLYAAILEEIARRIEAVRQLLLAPDAPMPNIELGALHLRKVLELIVMGSLVTNRTEIESITSGLQRKKAREARELAKAANPHYWPKGTLPFFGTPNTGSLKLRARCVRTNGPVCTANGWYLVGALDGSGNARNTASRVQRSYARPRGRTRTTVITRCRSSRSNRKRQSPTRSRYSLEPRKRLTSPVNSAP